MSNKYNYMLNNFIRACESGNVGEVKKLLQKPELVKRITDQNNRALREAAFKGRDAVVALLLKCPQVVEKITANDNEALKLAAYNGHDAVVARLLQYPAVVEHIITAEDNGALRRAAYNGHDAVVARLLECPAVVERITAKNNKALYSAVWSGHDAVVERLLRYSAVVALEIQNSFPNLQLAQERMAYDRTQFQRIIARFTKIRDMMAKVGFDRLSLQWLSASAIARNDEPFTLEKIEQLNNYSLIILRGCVMIFAPHRQNELDNALEKLAQKNLAQTQQKRATECIFSTLRKKVILQQEPTERTEVKDFAGLSL